MIPSFQYTAFVDTNPEYSVNQGARAFRSSSVGSLTLQEVTRNKELYLRYAGGTEFYSGLSNLGMTNSRSSFATFHQVSVGGSVDWRRWHMFVGDEGSYLPESPLGFTGFEGLTSFNDGLGGEFLWRGGTYNRLLQPDQSILGAYGRRISNTSIGQLQYDATARTTFTLTGAYGLLTFLDPGYLDGTYVSALGGVTHALGSRNYIGGTYLHSRIYFHAPHQDISHQGVIVSYGHRILGKLALEASVGYMLNQFAVSPGGSSSQRIVTTYNSLTYYWRRTNVKTYFSHWITGGSGILRGAETDSLGVRVGRQLSRSTHLDVHFGHYIDQSFTAAVPGAARAKSKAWKGGVQLSRELGRHVSVYIQYNIQRQVTNSSLCVASRCGLTFLRQIGGVGLNWHTRPIRLQ